MQQNTKSLRLIELLLLLIIAFGSSIFQSLCLEIAQYEIQYPLDSVYTLTVWGSKIISNLAAIFLLIYILFRQERNIFQLGFSWTWKDFIYSIPIAIIAFILCGLSWFVIEYIHSFWSQETLILVPNNLDILQSGITFWSITAMLVNPFYEELILRAFTITELKYITNNHILAFLFSVIIQSTYHLYQGLSSALFLTPMFIIFSIYYMRWGRIMPVILAHMYFDLISLFSHLR